MEAFVHNLNTMHSRAGAQVPFSSVNLGTDSSSEGRMVIKNFLLATESGLGKNETPIFPISIFKVKEGINYNPGDPSYDLFRLACRVSAKRLFPNFSFIDAPFNLATYKPGDYRTEVAYMGCRTRVLANVVDKEKAITPGRGNLSFTSINLPRIGIKHGMVNGGKTNIKAFYKELDDVMDLVRDQLLQRLKFQSNKRVYNAPFLMGQGVWIDSNKLKPTDKVKRILVHGTLSIGFIGLAETLKALIDKHHGESEEAQALGLEIISHMRKRCDLYSRENNLNFTLLATPAEGLSGRFTAIDKSIYGVIPGITDKEYYTNSFHVPVYYNTTIEHKIRTEAPYHALTNAGHISYIELDGDPSDNIDAFEKIVRLMKETGMGYGAVNHPVDRDPICGFTGVIGDQCPGCGRKESDGVKFDRIRRITGYLVGTVERFNNSKRAEERDRVKHT
jgi:ribonucleoside-triphosphate reductase